MLSPREAGWRRIHVQMFQGYPYKGDMSMIRLIYKDAIPKGQGDS